MIFLVRGNVECSHYGSSAERRDEDRIVIAASEKDAVDKFINHFESKSVSYAVSYTVFAADAYAAIE